MSLEFLKGKFGVIAYVSIFGGILVPAQEDPCACRVWIKYKDQVLFTLAHRMEGGQRILLPDEMTCTLLTLLDEGNTLMVVLEGGYTSTISPVDFKL